MKEEKNPSSDSKTPVSREQLYKEVWAEPMTTVALRYKVSSSFLARVCTWLNVPRPERGYWAKLAVGKASKQPSLLRSRVIFLDRIEHKTISDNGKNCGESPAWEANNNKGLQIISV